MVISLAIFQELGLEHLLDDIRSKCADKMDVYVMTHSECVQVHPLERKSALRNRVGHGRSPGSKFSLPSIEQEQGDERIPLAAEAELPVTQVQSEPAEMAKPGAGKKKLLRRKITEPKDHGEEDDGKVSHADTSPAAGHATTSIHGSTAKLKGAKTAPTRGTDAQLASIVKLCSAMQESAERNAAEILGRLREVEQKTEKLMSMASDSTS